MPRSRSPLIMLACLCLLLAGCAALGTPGGYGLVPGQSTLADVERRLGPPSLRWRDADGGEQLAFPQGPAGLQTWMAHVDAGGRLIRLENVLTSAHFARIRPGVDDHESVLRRLGPPDPTRSLYFEARDELAWEWRFCDDWNRIARFDVLFDGTSGRVRSTQQRREHVGPQLHTPWCGH